MKIFVSYSRRDAGDFANQIQRHLSIFNYDIFTDVDDIMVGEIWSNTIEENISNCDIFVVLVTDGALQSPHVEREVLQAQRENKIIIPCFYKNVSEDIKWELKQFQGVEFEEKYDLARNLQSEITKMRKKNYKNKSIYKYKDDQTRKLQGGASSFNILGNESILYKKNWKNLIIIASIAITVVISIVAVYFYSSGTTKTFSNMTTTNLSNKTVNVSIVSNASKANTLVSYDPPSPLFIDRDMEVKWNNNDSIVHSVTSGNPLKHKSERVGQLFDSGAIRPNQSFSYVFNTTGTFDYYCLFHPFTMSGQVIVS